ncbi:MAG: polysaccharide deacetylase family protein [Candidatus Lokiarchaeota archaeon]|nr:polysaccharide deacetylase family protein [Candidatus Lokiarchaeota archaeon]
MESIYITFTMDVERIGEKSPPGGPKSWGISKNSIESYERLLRKYEYPVTFFITPNAGEKHAELFKNLNRQGNECGLHLHPKAWNDNYKNPEEYHPIGFYNYKQQTEMLKNAKTQLQAALGIEPKSFRAGNFSANDDTYKALLENDIDCGSTSLPGRYIPRWNAKWRNKRHDVHKCNIINRLISGNMDFVDVPLTSKTGLFGILSRNGDTRFERVKSKEEVKYIIEAIDYTLNWQIKNKSTINHICLFTHNVYDYSPNPSGFERYKGDILQNFLDRLPLIEKKYDCKIVGETISGIRKLFLREQT